MTAQSILRRFWPPILVATALVAPIFIDTLVHPELFTAILLAGLVTAALPGIFGRGASLARLPVTLPLLAFVLYLGARSLFAPEPFVSFFGAYGLDGSLVAWLAAAGSLVALALWSRQQRSRGDEETPVVWLLISIAAYCTASGVAAWQWGSTDGVGGPASGFTANSQYQLQLLTVGLAAALSWGILKRKSGVHVAASVVTSVVLAVNIAECRSDVTVVAFVIAAAYVVAARLSLGRLSPRLFAGIWTGIVAAVGAMSTWALLARTLAPDVIGSLNTLGNGRGTLWASATRVFAENPLFGRGLVHATSVARWSLQGDVVDLTTTTDPHDVFLLLAAGGGVIGVLLALWVLFALQEALFSAVVSVPAQQRLPLLVLIAAAVAVLMFSLVAFAYPVAWSLAAVLLGVVCGRGAADERRPETATASVRVLAGVMAVLTVALMATLWTPVAVRSASLKATGMGGVASRAKVIDRQAALVSHSWNVMPAGTAIGAFSSLVRSDSAAAATRRTRLAEVQSTVASNMVWDARLASRELSLWAVDAQMGEADLASLQRIVEAGIQADPACGLWAAAGCAFMSREGATAQATDYAKRVYADPVWLAQVESSVDATTAAVIARLAGR